MAAEARCSRTRKIWTFVWIIALKPDGYVILSAHESVPCDDLFTPHFSCRTAQRPGSAFPGKIAPPFCVYHLACPFFPPAGIRCATLLPSRTDSVSPGPLGI
jgi:hypothetical protein